MVVAVLVGIEVGLLGGGFVGGGLCEWQTPGCGLEGIGYMLSGAAIGTLVALPTAVAIALRVERRGSLRARVALLAVMGLILLVPPGAIAGQSLYEDTHPYSYPRIPHECTVAPASRPPYCGELGDRSPSSGGEVLWTLGGAALGVAIGGFGFGALKLRFLRRSAGQASAAEAVRAEPEVAFPEEPEDEARETRWWQRPALVVAGTVMLVAALLAAGIFVPSTGDDLATCTYDASTRTVAVEGPLDFGFPELSVEGDAIMIREGDPPEWTPKRPCGAATTDNTDTILARGAADDHIELFLDLGGGAFAPGATAEQGGDSEIEVRVSQGSVDVTGSDGADNFRVGTLGANLNGDDDVDLSSMTGSLYLTLQGGPGDDDLRYSGGLGTGEPQKDGYVLGGAGSDTIVTALGRDHLSGGRGNDVLVGGSADDELRGGSGRDRCVGGSGKDVLRSCEDARD